VEILPVVITAISDTTTREDLADKALAPGNSRHHATVSPPLVLSEGRVDLRETHHPDDFANAHRDTVSHLGPRSARELFETFTQASKRPFKSLKPLFMERVESLTSRLKKRFQVPFRVLVPPKKLRISQKPELVVSPVQYRFRKSKAMIVKQALPKSSADGFLNSTFRELCVLVRRKLLELDVHALQSQNAFSPQRTAYNVQARHFPVTGM
jgi:hypothetical protein